MAGADRPDPGADGPSVPVPFWLRNADLPKRALTALVMLVVSGTALWLGGMAWTVFVLIIGIGVWFEWSTLVLQFKAPGISRNWWRSAGAIYCGIASAILIQVRQEPAGIALVLLIVGAVIGTDVGAYFMGRALGGPKIAPRISPSKTWAGLLGGVIGATLVIWIVLANAGRILAAAPDAQITAVSIAASPVELIGMGLAVAVVAQAGDFFESWMKRSAGVKDSGKLLPGHGGLFDRVDGLLSVLVVFGTIFIIARLSTLS
ncbi:phosphatidate cytidylyltransferase [Novosphingobium chloroacetimidivorans]|uniref:Phosphatidate cytidylyltransferase n=1 Tax=Novosphingobium chloroacetimidivorans TaxID=1428314 RepID=A0A7W7NWL7_9SPHN|nr:phosphatidate cytidylyltransferase [Novosphingobium chloroacetimidivorans]MBB4858544.1 phosphatidate cytidylyltransferase [Novosphingobium chloroacetimidivorans]